MSNSIYLIVERLHPLYAEYSVTIVDDVVTKATGVLQLLVGRSSDHAREFLKAREWEARVVGCSHFGYTADD